MVNPTNQCLFLSNNPTDFPSEKGFWQSHRVDTCKVIQIIDEAPPAHTATSARIDRDQPNASGAHTDQLDQVNPAPTNHITNDTCQQAERAALKCHPSNRITALLEGYIHGMRASTARDVRTICEAWCWTRLHGCTCLHVRFCFESLLTHNSPLWIITESWWWIVDQFSSLSM